MASWSIRVFRQLNKRMVQPTTYRQLPNSPILDVWCTCIKGPIWIEEIVKDGRAIAFPGNGYPYFYSAKSKYVIPLSRSNYAFEKNSLCVISSNHSQIAECQPDEWLLIEAWDES